MGWRCELLSTTRTGTTRCKGLAIASCGMVSLLAASCSTWPFRDCVTAMPYAFEHDGFAIATGIVPESQRLVLLAALGDPDGAGSRGLLAVPEVRAFARCEAMMSLVAAYLGQDAQLVRAIFFDKSVTSNWLVRWHQDLTIAVASKVDVPGFGCERRLKSAARGARKVQRWVGFESTCEGRLCVNGLAWNGVSSEPRDAIDSRASSWVMSSPSAASH